MCYMALQLYLAFAFPCFGVCNHTLNVATDVSTLLRADTLHLFRWYRLASYRISLSYLVLIRSMFAFLQVMISFKVESGVRANGHCREVQDRGKWSTMPTVSPGQTYSAQASGGQTDLQRTSNASIVSLRARGKSMPYDT